MIIELTYLQEAKICCSLVMICSTCHEDLVLTSSFRISSGKCKRPAPS